ncbi:MAG: dienelactone hydrolase family protein [Candidatus Acidiferrales bacterium]
MISERKLSSDGTEQEVWIQAGRAKLQGSLGLPKDAGAVVLFAHGSGSSRRSRRNRYVAQALHQVGVGTLLFDLLTAEEESADDLSGELRFDISLLVTRLADATRWVMQQPDMIERRFGYFGASTGAAAALVAAAQFGRKIGAVVSRGGRPDLAGEALERVKAPTLLIAGGKDAPVIGMNRRALQELGSEVKRIFIVPGATHLFEEPGTLEEVARLAADWFKKYLASSSKAAVQS